MKKVLNLYTTTGQEIMLHLVHRVTITTTLKTRASCKSKFTSQESSLDPVPSSIRARNAQEINITNCDVTTWSWVNLVNPSDKEAIDVWKRSCTSNPSVIVLESEDGNKETLHQKRGRQRRKSDILVRHFTHFLKLLRPPLCHPAPSTYTLHVVITDIYLHISGYSSAWGILWACVFLVGWLDITTEKLSCNFVGDTSARFKVKGKSFGGG